MHSTAILQKFKKCNYLNSICFPSCLLVGMKIISDDYLVIMIDDGNYYGSKRNDDV
jgi:hypothetical protein